MDHAEATRIQASSRYLMGGLTAAEAEAFEEHYFSCPECAEEVTSGAVFAENVKAVFAGQSGPRLVGGIAPKTEQRSRLEWRREFALPLVAAACVLLGVNIYQYTAIRSLKMEVAELSTPQELPWVPLRLARGETAFNIPHDRAFFMPSFRLPDAPAAPAYRCDIENSRGVLLRSVTLSAPPPGQPLALLLRRSDFPTGTYRFKIQPQSSSDVLATYTIDLNTN